jgi:hypothetical protein
VLLGNGDGTFRLAGSYGAGIGPGGLAAADLNGDGLIDLVVANHHSNNISVLIGKGDGTFRPAVHHAARWMPAGLAVADFDGDERPDVAVVNYLSHDLSVLRGRPPTPQFRLTSNFNVRAGTNVILSVFAVDASDNLDQNSVWKARLQCTDPRAEFPTTIEKTTAIGEPPIPPIFRFRTAGVQTVTVSDLADPARVGTAMFLVSAAETARFRVTAMERVVAEKPFTLAVAAEDEFGNVTTDFDGRVHLTATDGRAVLSRDYRFTGADSGSHKFKLTLVSPGMQTISLSDPTRPELSGRAAVSVEPRTTP